MFSRCGDLSYGVVPSFGELLSAAIVRVGMTRQAFAQRTQTAVSTISEVILGRRKPPLKRLDNWAKVLGLSDEECRVWKQAALVAHARPEVRQLIEELQKRIEKLSASPQHSRKRRRAAGTDSPKS